MKYNYGIMNVFLAGADNYIMHKGQYVYYSNDIEHLLYSANTGKRDPECYGILVDKTDNMFVVDVLNENGLLHDTVKCPAIIYSIEDVDEEFEPFGNKEDFVKNYLDHVPVNDGMMSELCGEYLLRPSETGYDLIAVLAIKDSGLSFIDDLDVSWENVMDNYYFLDRTICGRKVWKKSSQ